MDCLTCTSIIRKVINMKIKEYNDIFIQSVKIILFFGSMVFYGYVLAKFAMKYTYWIYILFGLLFMYSFCYASMKYIINHVESDKDDTYN